MAAYGNQAVRELLLARRASGSRFGQRHDGARVALVCASGGMRGVVAGGMVTALERHGFLDAFDIFCGASAGAFAVAYFCAGQAALGTRIYAEDLSGRRFISPTRFIGGGPVMDLDYLVDEIMVSVKPLNTKALLDRPESILFLTSDAVSGQSHVLRVRKDLRTAEDIRLALRASARIPLISGSPVEVKGHFLIDGGLSNAIPTSAALAAGATHMLVLVTVPFGAGARVKHDLVSRAFAQGLKRRFGRGVWNTFLGREAAYARTLDQLASGTIADSCGRLTAVGQVVGPNAGQLRLSAFCTDADLLRQGARYGELAVCELFEGTGQQ